MVVGYKPIEVYQMGKLVTRKNKIEEATAAPATLSTLTLSLIKIPNITAKEKQR